jgi:tetratricopeptide (TPR) repeat protein
MHPQSPMAVRRPVVRRDARGLMVTGCDAAGVAAIEAFAEIVLRRGQGAEAVLDAAAARPDCPMLQACAAACHLLADTRRGIRRALPLLEAAGRNLAAATDREAMFIAALGAIARGRPRLADAQFLALAAAAPHDLLAGYIGHLHLLNHGRFDAMLAHARRLHRASPSDPFVLGMLAFALEETGSPCAALDAALAANAVDPSIAWVHHAVGHVFKAEGRAADGLAWLMRHAHHWAGCGSSMRTHNWWHAQLLLLDLDDAAAALALYDRLIAAERDQSVSSFVNAAALLARLELRGVEIGARWQPLAEEARRRIGEHVLPFIDLHYGLALAYAGDLAACHALRRSARRHAARLDGELRAAWELAGLPLLDAAIACGLAHWRIAERSFQRGLPHVELLGGSGQQRELFHELRGHAVRRARASVGGRARLHLAPHPRSATPHWTGIPLRAPVRRDGPDFGNPRMET